MKIKVKRGVDEEFERLLMRGFKPVKVLHHNALEVLKFLKFDVDYLHLVLFYVVELILQQLQRVIQDHLLV